MSSTPTLASPNFGFLAKHDPRLVVLGAKAERYFAEDPATCLIQLRQLGEALAQRTAAGAALWTSTEENQVDLLRRLQDHGILTRELADLFHGVRKAGNAATHSGHGDHREALHQLKVTRQIAVWFHRVFSRNLKFDPGPFIPPPDPTRESEGLKQELADLRAQLLATQTEAQAAQARAAEEALQRQSAEERARQEAEERAIWESLASEAASAQSKLAQELAALQVAAAARPAPERVAIVQEAKAAAAEVELDEAATRRLIDQQLLAAGWDADTEELRYAKSVRPQRGRNIAIAEWPTENGPADYALFCGLELIAVVEAKRQNRDVMGSIQQAKRYSQGATILHDEALAGGPWGSYRVPFMFATNGRPFLRQLQQKSGIWFLDGRSKTNHPRALADWYTPQGLTDLLNQRDPADALDALKSEQAGFSDLRDYQVNAIKAIETALEDGKRQCLVAMATGTGKTRTFIGLIYRLIKSGRFRRILFLVDRSTLGDQAVGAFENAHVESLQTFTQIYNVKGLEDLRPDRETKLHFATIQGMVKRVLFAGDENARSNVDDYDCIVIDECHRGYTLDREMSDSELSFRDQDDYRSKYRAVLDYFDAVKIGLTATPALHTTEIFGDPVFQYSYREAVIDGWLVDHEPPIRIKTELSTAGIKWKAGEQVSVYNGQTQQLDLVHLDDELAFDVEDFNLRVVTESFNRVVCEYLATQFDTMSEGKTLVFCATDAHADLVVDLLKKALHERYGAVDDDAVDKITGSADKPRARVRRFKNERLPNIAVTVDLLTTGVDVPEIVNLVFLRRVKSRILYEQMLGRGTRLCPEIGKEFFRIYDAVDLYAALEPFTSMKPVAANPTFTFAQLLEEVLTVKDEAAKQLALDQLVVKIQRKKRHLSEAAHDQIETATGGSVAGLVDLLRRRALADVVSWLSSHRAVADVLDRVTGAAQYTYVSQHVDAFREVEHGYGPGRTRPQDYLDAFSAFIRENMNSLPALMVVTQRPRELTRKQLRELELALSHAGYTELGLQTAWREMTNQDIAASIIGFIRQRALGEPLVPYAERVDRAVKTILTSRAWTTNQRQWLERIAKQLRTETVVDRDALDRGQFEAKGGFSFLNKVFDGKLEQVLGDINDALWKEVG